MEHYVTLFDSLFLPQGLALHHSLERWGRLYTLWILCLDDVSYDVLSRLRPENVRLLRVGEVETPELLRVKPGRTRAEYCWTLTPFAPRFVFDAAPEITRVTYVDADLWLLRNPAPIFEELDESGKHVLITRHAYAPEYDKSSTSGRFCVQFMAFSREGEGVRKWWEERCIEWCFAKPEDGKFGDQKYLDDWPERFAEQVHVLQHQEWVLAPWNATRFPYGDALVYHFHGLRLQDGGRISVGDDYALPPVLMSDVYQPYIHTLREVIGELRRIGFDPPPQQARPGVFAAMRRRLEDIYVQRWRLRIHGAGSLWS
jgi:hypothetical protein